MRENEQKRDELEKEKGAILAKYQSAMRSGKDQDVES
jgi:hypothetical protein